MADAQTRGRNLLFAIFTISGFSGLIYESIWSHYLKLFLGHAAYAQTLVLAIFMGGMAVGSWIASKRSARIVNLLLAYAIVEGVIGLLGLVFHKTSVGVTSWAFSVLLPNLGSPFLAQMSKWTLGAILILPQSILLGMTFPLMSGAIVRRYPQRAGETLAMLYFTNSLGAAIGVLVSGFYLIGVVGLPGTIMTAGLLNVALALTVWGIVKYQPEAVQPAIAATADGVDSKAIRILRAMLVGAAITGAAAFLYEIAWIRMLSLVLGSSTHSFELMLSAFILGIALGGLWIRRRIDGLTEPVRFLGRVLVVMSCVALLSLPIYNSTFDIMSYAYRMFSPTEQGYVGFNLASHTIALLLMIPTTFFCGMTLPIMTHTLLRVGIGERAIGAIYAWNTGGTIIGVFAAVHLLMPIIGVKGVVISGAVLHLALGIGYLGWPTQALSPFRLPRLATAVGVAAVAATIFFVQLDPSKLSSGVFRHGYARQTANSKVLLLKHGKTATVSLVDIEGHGQISISTNGKPDASIMMRGDKSAPDEITMVLAGAMPVALHPNPKRIANIGIGSGLTTHVLLASDSVETVDTVEIEPYMAKAAEIGFMPRVQRTFRDPRSHIYFEDAKTFFAVHRKKYDVIVSEPSNPWVSGVATLFSEEFYRQITNYLEPDGLLIQWIQTYETDISIVVSVIKALAPQFADFALYNTDDTNVLIVATRRGTLPLPDARVFDSAAMKAELQRVGITSVRDFDGRFLGNKALFMPLLHASGTPPNSDYFPFVDLNAPRARILKRSADELSSLASLPLPFFDLLDGSRQARAPNTFRIDSYLQRDFLVSQALALRDAFNDPDFKGITPEASRVLMTLRSSPATCNQPVSRRAWLDSVFFISARTSGVLDANELSAMWAEISKTPCAQVLAGDDQQLFEVLRALAQRDVDRVAATGAALFAAGYEFDDATKLTTVLLATAACQVASGKKAEALKLLQAHGTQSETAPAFALAQRWVTAIAAEPANRVAGVPTP